MNVLIHSALECEVNNKQPINFEFNWTLVFPLVEFSVSPQVSASKDFFLYSGQHCLPFHAEKQLSC